MANNVKLLLVDDNPMVLRMLRDALTPLAIVSTTTDAKNNIPGAGFTSAPPLTPRTLCLRPSTTLPTSSSATIACPAWMDAS